VPNREKSGFGGLGRNIGVPLKKIRRATWKECSTQDVRSVDPAQKMLMGRSKRGVQKAPLVERTPFRGGQISRN